MRHLVLVFILIVAIFFRLFKLDQVPPSVSLDEASLGWNAYSLLKTGKDEFGVSFPLILRAYDDYRPALYAYTIIPFLPVFGLTAFAVRFPSVIYSIISIICCYILTNYFINKKILILSHEVTAGHISSFLLAISPWHIYLSRLGHEVNLGFVCYLCGLTFYFLAFQNRKNIRFLMISAIFFVLSFGSYQSEKIITPLTVLGLLFIYKNNFFQFKKTFLLSALVGLLIFIPLILPLFSKEGLIRFSGTSALSQDNPLYETRKKLFVDAKIKKDIWKEIINYPRLTPVVIVASQYFSHFSPQWLFHGNLGEAHKIPHMGLLYWWELPLFIVGLYVSSQLVLKKDMVFIIYWIIISFIPASITTQAPHAMRSFTVLPSWQIIVSIGIIGVLLAIKNKFKMVFVILVCFFCLYEGFQIYQNYFNVFPFSDSQFYSYPFKPVMAYLAKVESNYPKIIFSKRIGKNNYFYPSYMLFLFYSRYNPEKYLSYGGTISGGFDQEHIFDQYEFTSSEQMKLEKNVLYIQNTENVPTNANILFNSPYLNGKEGISVYTF